MIGYYPCAVVAILLIYLRSTNQKQVSDNVEQIQYLLCSEKTVNDDAPREVACELTLEEKKELCEDAMEYTIFHEHDDGTLPSAGEFINEKSIHEVSPLVNRDDPYKCKKILIDGLDMEKPMYWCPHRVYKIMRVQPIQAKGFFVSSSRRVLDTVILFRPSETNAQAVTPFFEIVKADSLKEKAKLALRKAHASVMSRLNLGRPAP